MTVVAEHILQIVWDSKKLRVHLTVCLKTELGIDNIFLQRRFFPFNFNFFFLTLETVNKNIYKRYLLDI